MVVDVDQDPEDHGEGDTDVPFVVCPSEGYKVDATVVVVLTTVIVCALVIVCAVVIVFGSNCWMCGGGVSWWQICEG